MEKKEIVVSKDKIMDAMAKSTSNITNKAPKGNANFAMGVTLISAMLASELIDILFGGGYRPQLMRRVTYDFAR